MSDLPSQSVQPRQLLVVWTTVARIEDAERLAEGLVKTQLAACVQIDAPTISVYRWREDAQAADVVCRETERRLWIKTVADQLPAIEAYFAEHHPYDVPQVITVPADGSAGYVDWASRCVS